VARRPAFAESAEKPKVLVAACAEVPGPSAEGVRAEQFLLAFSGGLEVDALSLKGKNLTHIQRVGAARMLRVPVNDAVPADNTAAHSAFKDRLAAFKRALVRQLENDRYDVVVCLDLFVAAAALPSLGPARLVLEVSDIPSLSFDQRHQVASDDKDTRTTWELGERAALKAASLILAPSRHAAKLLSERANDPRIVRVFPRLIDTRIFQPPTVEIDLDDGATVAFLGGREGGLRGAVLTTAVKLLGARSEASRFLFVGTPGRGDQPIKDALVKRDLTDRGTFVDATTPADVQQALCAADVVVIIGDLDGFAIPHRALEAMACGRAVVIAASEHACKDHIVADQHAKIVPADAPERIADTVSALLQDPAARGRLKKPAQRQAVRFDLGARAAELGAMLTEATGVAFVAKLPPLEEVTQPAPIPRAVPVTPLSQKVLSNSANVSRVPSLSEPAGVSARDTEEIRSASPVPLVDSELPPSLKPAAASLGDFGEGDELDEESLGLAGALDGPTLDESALPAAVLLRAAAPKDAAAPAPVDVDPPVGQMLAMAKAADSATDERAGGDAVAGDDKDDDESDLTPRQRPSQTGRPFVPRSAVRGLSGEGQAASGDVWAGDTMFDPSAMRQTSAPKPEKIKGAMLRTELGPSVAVPPAPVTTPEASAFKPRPDLAKSLGVQTTGGGADEWGQDTIADASPIPDPTKAPSVERAVITHPPKSFLVEHGVGDMTAEDGVLPAASQPDTPRSSDVEPDKF